MKRAKLDMFVSLSRQRFVQVLIFIGFVYVVLVGLEIPFVFKTGFSLVSQEGFEKNRHLNSKSFVLESEEDMEERNAPNRPLDVPVRVMDGSRPERRKIREVQNLLSNLVFDGSSVNMNSSDGFSGILKSAKEAFNVGIKFWGELELHRQEAVVPVDNDSKKTEECPHSISISGLEFQEKGRMLVLPCGLTLGSHITVVGKPRKAHPEHEPKISLLRNGQYLMVSQFMMELQGLKTVDGEDPPRILHFNPRLKGDWSGKPVIEHNTCYRMQWGTSQRCDGLRSKDTEETVDRQVKCENWIRDDDDNQSEQSKSSWWLNRLITGRTKKMSIDWPYPFSEDKLFVLTLSAGFEGYHINVDGRHVTSFPYRTGFSLEDATGLSLNGDIDVDSVFAASLPATHPNFAPQRHLDMSNRWKAPPLLDQPVDLFIG